MVLLTTRNTKGKLEQALDLSNKKANYAFEDVSTLKVEVSNTKKESDQAWKNRNNAWKKSQQNL